MFEIKLGEEKYYNIPVDQLVSMADSIYKSDLPKQIKIIRLWCIAQLNYQGIASERASYYLRVLTDSETTNAIFFVTGFSYGKPKIDDFLRLLTGGSFGVF